MLSNHMCKLSVILFWTWPVLSIYFCSAKWCNWKVSGINTQFLDVTKSCKIEPNQPLDIGPGDLCDPASITKILNKIMLCLSCPLAVLTGHIITTSLIRGTSSCHFWKTWKRCSLPQSSTWKPSGQRKGSFGSNLASAWVVLQSCNPKHYCNH